MSVKMGSVGGNVGGVAFEDGVFDGVKKVTVGYDSSCVTYIKIEYEKDGKFETRERGKQSWQQGEFSVDYPNEYITSVGGSYGHVFRYERVMIRSLFFKTSHGRTSSTFGCTFLGFLGGTQFMLEGKNGGKLLGFHGRSSEALDAIGPHFFTVDSSLKHFPPQGGNGNGREGIAWDDGAYDGVRRVVVARNGRFVRYVRFEYAKGQRTVPHDHGQNPGYVPFFSEGPQEFVVDYPDEHITVVEGTIGGFFSALTSLTSLMFRTSKGRASPLFGNVSGRKFVLGGTGFKLVGVCGRLSQDIDALGAHFAPLPTPAPAPAPAPSPAAAPAPRPTPAPASNPTPAPSPRPASATASNPTSTPASAPAPASNPAPTPVPVPASTGTGANSGGSGLGTGSRGPQKLEALGGEGGNKWDDGADHDGVMKIYVAAGGRGIENIRFDYAKNGKTKEGTLRGVRARGLVSTVSISHPDEYLVSVEGWYDSSNIIQGIKFQTNNTTSDFIGYKFSGNGTQFSLQVKDKKIIGFHGSATSHLNSLGAYFGDI